MTTTTEDLTTMSAEELVALRDRLAYERRTDASVVGELEAVEREVGRRQSETDRTEAAEREEQRRVQAEAAAQAEKARKALERDLAKTAKLRGENATDFDLHLAGLAACLSVDERLGADMVNLATQLGRPGESYRLDLYPSRRISVVLAAATNRERDFNRSIDSHHYGASLSEALRGTISSLTKGAST